MPRSLLITLGDPDGLGPELVCRLAASDPGALPPRILLLGPAPALSHHARRLGMEPFWRETGDEDPSGLPDGVWLYCPPEVRDFEPRPGAGRPEGGLAAGAALEAACRLLRSGAGSALATCPLNKAMLAEAGFDFPGHTEFLATRLGVGPDNVCMHLCGPRLRVSLVTTHPRLADVPGLVTFDRVLRCLRLTAAFLADIGADGKQGSRSVAVCGLNPHAGESGRIGDEEAKVIAPAVEAARAEGLDVHGPLPGDTVFRLAADGRFGAVLAMYHDQGLAPLKLLHFHEAVNVTLGLPAPRTSVDHGTGYDLVGRDTADVSSLRLAVDLAVRMARSRAES